MMQNIQIFYDRHVMFLVNCLLVSFHSIQFQKFQNQILEMLKLHITGIAAFPP